MVITTTAVGFILLAAGVAVLGWQFLRFFKRGDAAQHNRKIIFLIELVFFSSVIQNGIVGFGTLFFSKNPFALYLSFLASQPFLVSFAISGICLLYYVFLPGRSPWVAMAFTGILGMMAIVLTSLTPSSEFALGDSINLSPNLPVALSTFLLLLISLGIMTYVFVQIFLRMKNRDVKILSLTIAILAFAGIINVFIRLVLLYNAPIYQSNELFGVVAELIGAGFVILIVVLSLVKGFIFNEKKRRSRIE